MRMFDRASAPTWLFSFVDISLLLLIAVTALSRGESPLLDVAELRLPQVRSDAAEAVQGEGDAPWLLQVHPPGSGAGVPFALSQAGDERVDLDRAALESRLADLRGERGEKPLLAPHEDARAADLLTAAALLEDLWPSARTATIAPVAAAPPQR